MSANKIFLLSIGINVYAHQSSLGFCIKDAQNISATLRKRAPDCVVRELNEANEQVTSAHLKKSISEISTSIEKDTVAIVFFAGHGFAAEGKDYLACIDTKVENLETAVSTTEIIEAFASAGIKNLVLIVDACRSEIERSVTNVFGERTAELARRAGIITFFACSPKQTSKELPLLDGGIFTHAFCKLLSDVDIPFTPYEFNRALVDNVKLICEKHNLSAQTPYTTVAPLEKAALDILTGEAHRTYGKKKQEMILIVGPTNAGKTTIGQHLATKHGYAHAEMSSFAWKRLHDRPDFRGGMQNFMETEVWKGGNEDAIAKDLIATLKDQDRVVVCGPRRMEEIETIMSAGWDVKPIFIFSDATNRFKRLQNSSGRYGPTYKEFVTKDLKEFGWGIADMIGIKHIDVVINETCVNNYVLSINEVLGYTD